MKKESTFVVLALGTASILLGQLARHAKGVWEDSSTFVTIFSFILFVKIYQRVFFASWLFTKEIFMAPLYITIFFSLLYWVF